MNIITNGVLPKGIGSMRSIKSIHYLHRPISQVRQIHVGCSNRTMNIPPSRLQCSCGQKRSSCCLHRMGMASSTTVSSMKQQSLLQIESLCVPLQLFNQMQNYHTSVFQCKRKKHDVSEDEDEGEDENSNSFFDGPEMNEQAINDVMLRHVNFFKNRLQPISVRTQPSLIEELTVSGEVAQSGSHKKVRISGKIKQYGNVIVKNPRLLSVNVFDPEHVGIVDRAIRDSDLGFNPEVKGTQIDVPIPKVTSEVKDKYLRTIKEYSEDAKKRIRSTRQNIMKTIAKEKKSGVKDAAFRNEKTLQNIHDKFIKEVDDIASKKSQEIQRG